MKKGLCVLAAAAMVFGVHADEEAASEEETNIGIGVRADLNTDGNFAPAFVVRWAPASLGGEALLSHSGTDSDSGGISFKSSRLMLAGKVFYSFIENENSSMYAGGKLGFAHSSNEVNGSKSDTTDVIFGGLVGAEWRPDTLPEIGINFEVGYDITSNSDNTLYGLITSLGATYYF